MPKVYSRKRKSNGRATVRGRSRFTRKSAATRLARFAQSRFRYRKGRTVSRSLRSVGETKLIAVGNLNEWAPSPIQVGAIAYQSSFVLGTVPTGWTEISALGGTSITQGTSAQERVGDYVYLKKTHYTFTIQMRFGQTPKPPHEFRVIVGKTRRAVNPAGITHNPAATLFLNTIGQPIGHTSGGINGSDLMLQPLNKREFVIKMDKKFTMSSPIRTDSDGGGVGYHGYYPVKKDIPINFGFWKKTRYNTNNLPDDIDCAYFVYIYASCIDKDAGSNGWEVSGRGTTSYQDP